MRASRSISESRRRFLQYLAASPLLATPAVMGSLGGKSSAATSHERGFSLLEDGAAGGGLITSADQALDVMEFEPVARKVLPPAHFGYWPRALTTTPL